MSNADTGSARFHTTPESDPDEHLTPAGHRRYRFTGHDNRGATYVGSRTMHPDDLWKWVHARYVAGWHDLIVTDADGDPAAGPVAAIEPVGDLTRAWWSE